MQKATGSFAKIDMVLIRAFTRLSHLFDYRFHVNQFEFARYVMTGSIALFCAQTVQDVIRNWDVDKLAVSSVIVAFGLCASIFSIDLGRLHRASDDYETHPNRISRDAAHYLMMPFYLRLTLLFLGTLVALFLTIVDLTTRRASLPYFIENFWIMLAGCSWYIAGGLPPHRDRKKKKERAQVGAVVQVL